jgi:hypothetical protein
MVDECPAQGLTRSTGMGRRLSSPRASPAVHPAAAVPIDKGDVVLMWPSPRSRRRHGRSQRNGRAIGSRRPVRLSTAGVHCVAAYSSVCTLYSTYPGPLHQLQRASDRTTGDVGLLATGDYANAATQDLRQTARAVYQQQNDDTSGFATDATFCEVPGDNGQGSHCSGPATRRCTCATTPAGSTSRATAVHLRGTRRRPGPTTPAGCPPLRGRHDRSADRSAGRESSALTAPLVRRA